MSRTSGVRYRLPPFSRRRMLPDGEDGFAACFRGRPHLVAIVDAGTIALVVPRPVLWLVTVLTALAGVSMAGAHGDAPHRPGYVSTVSELRPNIVGVLVQVLDGDQRLLLRNWSGRRILILGASWEPYLRFDARGVWENVASPTSALNRPEGGPLPATRGAGPRWRRVSTGTG